MKILIKSYSSYRSPNGIFSSKEKDKEVDVDNGEGVLLSYWHRGRGNVLMSLFFS